jgi:hypothetical protein
MLISIVMSEEYVPTYEDDKVEHGSQFTSCLNRVANHEAKLLLAAAMADQPEKWFTSRELHNVMYELQGSALAWPLHRAAPISYCTKSFFPAGFVERGSVASPSGAVQLLAYRATKKAKKWCSAMHGALVDWSLEYPDISLQEALGQSTSPTKTHSPEIRYGIYLSLLGTEETLDFRKISEPLTEKGYTKKVTEAQIWDLRALGILVVTEESLEKQDDLTASSNNATTPTVRINPSHLSAVSSLCNRLRALESGINLESFAERSRQLLDDTAACHVLMDKARRHSKRFKGATENPEVLPSVVHKLIRQLGRLTIKEAQSMLHDQGHTLSVEGTRGLLNAMVGSGQLKVEITAIGPKRKNVVNVYTEPTSS